MLAPSSLEISTNWSKLLFPLGPTVDYTYDLNRNQLIRTQKNILFSSFSRNSSFKSKELFKSSYPKHVLPFNLLLSSHHNQVECNIETWGTIIERVLALKGRHHQVRLEKCSLLALQNEESDQLITSLSKRQTHHSQFDLTKGPCLFLRFSADISWDKLKLGPLFTQPCIYICDYLESIHNFI